jgi:hypothetical protein
MPKWLMAVLGAVGAVGVAVAGLVAAQPADFSIERSEIIAARPEVVFAEVQDFRRWQAWSPWMAMDPKAVNTYEGEPGVGHANAWKGEQTGVGKQVITESVAPSEIGMDLTFIEPFEAHNRVKFTFTPEPTGTKVVWTMTGTNDFFGKAFFLFSGSKAVGDDFERGLASLKGVAEKAEAARREADAAAAAAAAAASTEDAVAAGEAGAGSGEGSAAAPATGAPSAP